MAHKVGLQAVLGRRRRGEGLRRRKLRAAAQQEDELGAGCWFGQPAAGRQLLGTEDAGCGRRRLLEELLSSALGRRGFGGLVLQREAATGDEERDGCSSPDPDWIEEAVAAGATGAPLGRWISIQRFGWMDLESGVNRVVAENEERSGCAGDGREDPEVELDWQRGEENEGVGLGLDCLYR